MTLARYYMRRTSPLHGPAGCDELRETGASLILARRRREPLDILCLFPAVGCIIFAIYDFYICFCYIERGVLIYCIIPCTLAGLMSRTDAANAITWKNLSPVSRNPGTAILGSRLTGRLSCNCEVDFCCV